MCFEYKFGSSLAFPYYFMVVLYSCWNGLADLTGQPKLLNQHVQTYIVHTCTCTLVVWAQIIGTHPTLYSPSVRCSCGNMYRHSVPLCPFLIVYNPLNIEDHSMATNVPRPPFQSSNCLWHFMQKNHHLVSPLLLNRLSTHTHASDNRDVSNTWPAITWWASVEHRYKHHSFLSQTGLLHVQLQIIKNTNLVVVANLIFIWAQMLTCVRVFAYQATDQCCSQLCWSYLHR